MIEIRRALLSVSDKRGLVEFGRGLLRYGVELVSTGGTYNVLKEAGLPVTYISEVTGFPEILDGRVKTLHPAIHAGILARRDDPRHLAQLEEAGIKPIDLVVVNLYPFAATVARPGVTPAEAVENIDIGGPSLIRAAAKNHAGVVVIVDPETYPLLLAEMEAHGGKVTLEFARARAVEAFAHTAAYDAAIHRYLAGTGDQVFPALLELRFEKVMDLRYGENPHQRAAFYRDPGFRGFGVSEAEKLQGKELSFNNIGDADTAMHLAAEFDPPTVVAVKHANPCGVGTGPDLLTAFRKAYESDPVSIFGGIIAVNRELDGETARAMAELFLEIVIAPSFSEEARKILAAKKNLRLLRLAFPAPGDRPGEGFDLRRVSGGLLVQDRDLADYRPADLVVKTKRPPTEAELHDLAMAWKVVKYVKSNAIVLWRDGRTVGIGAGQMNRVGAARIAIAQAGEKARGAVLASDAFFPMPDTVEEAARAGITAIIQPGGSIRDDESIAAADSFGLAMVFTGMRHFRH
ncbi:MAG: bifunctional phosphoribosylaminoimidazolecarboxamide formyltransferase/IMP cyclohydrolase [Firmicutes bacterium]|nr:bifunctional phosphoribosylaminoimidazolecarboxamide formyltransferase/IMP cyclohydrolase [Bacillota bacterium]